MSEPALPKLKYVCLESGLLQSKAISVYKSSLAGIYKTPSASLLAFPHPPSGGLEQPLMLSSILLHHIPVLVENTFHFPLQQLTQLYQVAVLPRTARNIFSAQALSCAVNKHFTMNTPNRSTQFVHLGSIPGNNL